MLILMTTTAGQARAAFLGDVFKPFASLTGVYDSNIFRVPDRNQLKALVGDDQGGDFLMIASVGTELHCQPSRQAINLLMQKDFLRYDHYSDQDADRDQASGDIRLTLFDEVHLKLAGSYLKTPQPRIDYRNAEVNKATRSQIGAALDYEMGSGIGFEATFDHITVGYSLAQYRPNEYDMNRYGGSIWYRISPEVKLNASYLREDTDFRHQFTIATTVVDNNNVGDSFRLGVEKAISPKTTLSGYVGYLNRRHEAASARDFSGVIGRVAGAYGLTTKIGLVLNWERQLYEETYQDRIYSITDAVGGGVTYQFSEKVKGSLFDKLTWKDFQDVAGSGVAPRTDFINELNTEIEWTPIKRLVVTIGYQFENRSSDDDSFNFRDHTVSAGIAYRF